MKVRRLQSKSYRGNVESLSPEASKAGRKLKAAQGTLTHNFDDIQPLQPSSNFDRFFNRKTKQETRTTLRHSLILTFLTDAVPARDNFAAGRSEVIALPNFDDHSTYSLSEVRNGVHWP